MGVVIDYEMLNPIKAMVFYGTEKDVRYIQLHDIEQNIHGFSLSAGRPISKDGVRNIVCAFNENLVRFSDATQILPDNVLVYRPHDAMVAWYQPALRRPMYIKHEGGFELSGVVWWPALLFAVMDDDLFIFGLDSNKRPNANTPLYYAPLWNIFEKGNLCFGNVKKPDHVSVDTLVEWENALYDSVFTHPNGVTPRVRGNFVQIWEDLAKTNKRFPKKELVPFAKTFGQWLEQGGES